VDTVERSEMVEKELDAMIRRRHDHRVKDEGERAEEVLWAESERRYFAKQREQNRWEWIRYFGRIAFSLRERADEYDQRAAALLETSGHHHKESAGA
jgi:hypothetical protein